MDRATFARGARRWYAAFLATLESLKNTPQHCSRAPENVLIASEIRQITFKTRCGNFYRVLFHLRNREVLILHVRGSGEPLLSPDDLRQP